MPKIVRLTVRLPRELHRQLEKLADQNRRSLNAQIIYMLEQLAEEKKDD